MEGAASGVLASAHDSSEGGLAVCLAEIAITGNYGLQAELPEAASPEGVLFGEVPGRVVVGAHQEEEVRRLARKHRIGIRRLGRTDGTGEVSLRMPLGNILTWSLVQLRESYEQAISVDLAGV